MRGVAHPQGGTAHARCGAALQWRTMDKQTAQQLTRATTRFYAAHAASFSATRTRPWAGWYRCADMLVSLAGAGADSEGADTKSSGMMKSRMGAGARGGGGAGGAGAREGGGAGGKRLELLDLACGNLRFERFMHEAHPALEMSVNAVDGDDALVFDLARGLDAAGELSYRHLDIVEALHTERALLDALEAPVCDAAVCFGFFHHVPQFLWRRRLLETLVKSVRPGGLAMLTLWQFADDDDARKKARASTARAAAELEIDEDELGTGDYILGWQGTPGAWRYCHHFSDAEIERLVSPLEDAHAARLAASFQADGRSGHANRYLVFERT